MSCYTTKPTAARKSSTCPLSLAQTLGPIVVGSLKAKRLLTEGEAVNIVPAASLRAKLAEAWLLDVLISLALSLFFGCRTARRYGCFSVL